MIQEIERAAQQAGELTDEMLVYAGRSDSKAEKIDLGALVQDMVRLIKISVPPSAELALRFRDDLPEIVGDGGKLRQAVMNLVLNAVEYLPPMGGFIAIATGTETLDRAAMETARFPTDATPGTYVYLEISDTGVGMDAKTQRRVFDPFFTTQSHGRGLGLATVLGTVRNHGGGVRVDSSEGRGTSFRLYFPTAHSAKLLDEAEATAPTDDTPEAIGIDSGGDTESPWPKGGAILVVDDEEIVRLLAASILEETGCEILTAANGYEAVEIVDRRGAEICVVLLDKSMPGIDGAETLRRMCRIRPDLRVVVSSGYRVDDAFGDLDEAHQPAGFIRKPYRPAELIEALQAVL